QEGLDLREDREHLIVGGHRRLPAEPRSDLEVFLDREVGEDPAILGRIPDAQPGPLVGRQSRDVLGLETDGAAPRRQQAHDRVDGRRLARAVAPDQADGLAGAQRERDRAEDLRRTAVGLAPLELKHRTRCAHLEVSGVPISVVSTFSSRRISSGVPSARIVPWCMATMRSEYEKTTSMSCSMMAAEMCSERTTAEIVSMMGAFSRVLTPLVGSSRNSSLGLSA